MKPTAGSAPSHLCLPLAHLLLGVEEADAQEVAGPAELAHLGGQALGSTARGGTTAGTSALTQNVVLQYVKVFL